MIWRPLTLATSYALTAASGSSPLAGLSCLCPGPNRHGPRRSPSIDDYSDYERVELIRWIESDTDGLTTAA
jgi:hypothetical protein